MKFWRKSDKPKSDLDLLSLKLECADGTPLITFPAEVVDSLRRTLSRLVTRKILPARLSLIASLHQEGVTYLSRALALTMANDLDSTVCAVELNWWSPDQSLPLPVENLGLAGVLAGEMELKDALVRTNQPNLAIMTAGKMPVTDRPIFSRSSYLKEILYQLNEQFEYIILDIPAITSTNDSIPLASLGDACCLVIHQGVTPVEKVRSALNEIDQQKFLGAILNHTQVYTPQFLHSLIPQDSTIETSTSPF